MKLNIYRTGPAAEINLMGYAKTSQMAHGIHMRLRARTFIIAEPPTALHTSYKTANEHVAYADAVVADEEQERLRLRRKSGFENIPTERAFDPSKSLTLQVSRIDPDKAICFVSMDAGMVRLILCLCREYVFLFFQCKLHSHSIFLSSSYFGCKGSDLLNMRVLDRLKELLPKQANSDKQICHLENLSIRYVRRIQMDALSNVVSALCPI
jgi:hypothetical protein